MTCPSCGQQLTPGRAACAGCGAPPLLPGRPVRALAGWSALTMWAVAVTALVILVYAFLPLLDLWAVRAASSSGSRAPAVLSILARLAVGGSVVLAGGTAAVGFLGWLYRAYANLTALGGTTPPRFRPGLAVGAWFIPVANYLLPGLVMAELARKAGPAGDARTARRGVVLAWVWWLAYLAANLTMLVGTGLTSSPAVSQLRSAAASGASVDVAEATGLLGEQVTGRLPGALCYLGAAVLALLVVHRVTAGQYDRIDEVRAVLTAAPAAPGGVPAPAMPGGVPAPAMPGGVPAPAMPGGERASGTPEAVPAAAMPDLPAPAAPGGESAAGAGAAGMPEAGTDATIGG